MGTNYNHRDHAGTDAGQDKGRTCPGGQTLEVDLVAHPHSESDCHPIRRFNLLTAGHRSVTELPGNNPAIALSSYHPIRPDRFGLRLQINLNVSDSSDAGASMQSLTMDPCHRRCFSAASAWLMVVADKGFHLPAILFLTQSPCNASLPMPKFLPLLPSLVLSGKS